MAELPRLAASSRTLHDLAGVPDGRRRVAGTRRARAPASGAQISASFFSLLGVRPALGRDFTGSRRPPRSRRRSCCSPTSSGEAASAPIPSVVGQRDRARRPSLRRRGRPAPRLLASSRSRSTSTPPLGRTAPSRSGSSAAITRACASSAGWRPARRSTRRADRARRIMRDSRRSTPRPTAASGPCSELLGDAAVRRDPDDALDAPRGGGPRASHRLRQRRAPAARARRGAAAGVRHPPRARRGPRPGSCASS